MIEVVSAANIYKNRVPPLRGTVTVTHEDVRINDLCPVHGTLPSEILSKFGVGDLDDQRCMVPVEDEEGILRPCRENLVQDPEESVAWFEIDCPRCGNRNRQSRRRCRACNHQGRIVKTMPVKREG